MQPGTGSGQRAAMRAARDRVWTPMGTHLRLRVHPTYRLRRIKQGDVPSKRTFNSVMRFSKTGRKRSKSSTQTD